MDAPRDEDHITTNPAGDPAQRPLVLADAGALGITPADLDDLVHDLASTKASAINNGGLDAQIAFLLDQLGEADTEQVIRAAAAHR